MLKLLFYGESPLNPTGFGTVNKHILEALTEVSQVTCVASTHYVETYDTEEYPYPIVGSPVEDQRNLKQVLEYVKAKDWDIFFYQGDVGANNDVLDVVAQITAEDPAKSSIFYMPVDCDVAVGGAFYQFMQCSAPVVYTHHAHSVIERYAYPMEKYVSVIWLGTEPTVFYRLDDAKRKEVRARIFGLENVDRFICLCVQRNQERKDLARLMSAYHLFHVKYPDSMLYMHSVRLDSGGDLAIQAHMGGCDIFAHPCEIAFSALDLSKPWTREQLNDLYNACDVLLSTSLGEGWGLSTTEALCAELPVLVPGNTANLDIIGTREERGWFIKTGGDLDHTIFTYGAAGGGPHDIIHSASFVEKLEYIYTHPFEVREKALVARQWCLENTWKERQEEWKKLILTVEEQMSTKTTN